MGGRDDGHGFLGDIDAKGETGFVDIGKSLDDEIFGSVRDIKKEIVLATNFEFMINGPGHDVSGGQFSHGMVFLHEGGPCLGEEESGSFPTKGLADQKGFGVGMIKTRGVKLDKFKIADRTPRTIGHRDTVTRGNVGIGGVEIDLSGASTGQHGYFCGDGLYCVVVFVEDVGAQALIGLMGLEAELVCGDEIDGDLVIHDFDIGVIVGRMDQRSFNFGPRDISRMEYAAV